MDSETAGGESLRTTDAETRGHGDAGIGIQQQAGTPATCAVKATGHREASGLARQSFPTPPFYAQGYAGLRLGGEGVGMLVDPEPESWLPKAGTIYEVRAAAIDEGFTHWRRNADGFWTPLEQLQLDDLVGIRQWKGRVIDDGQVLVLPVDPISQTVCLDSAFEVATADRIQRFIWAHIPDPPAIPVDWLPGKARVAELVDAALEAGFTHYRNPPDWLSTPEETEWHPLHVPASAAACARAPLTILVGMHVCAPGGRWTLDADVVEGVGLRVYFSSERGNWHAIADLAMIHGPTPAGNLGRFDPEMRLPGPIGGVPQA